MEDRKRFWILLLPADLCRREFFSMMGNSTVIPMIEKPCGQRCAEASAEQKLCGQGFTMWIV